MMGTQTIVSLKSRNAPMDTPESYYEQIWNNISLISLSMNHNAATSQGMNTYYHLINSGFKKRGYYETQLPHFVKVVVREDEKKGEGNTDMIMFRTTLKKSGFAHTAMIEVSQKHGISSGLYLCTLSLTLSNPLWRPEHVYPENQPSGPQVWELQGALKNIPSGQSKKCNGEIGLTLTQYMGQLPSALTPPSWQQRLLHKVTTEEFRSCFDL